MVFSCVAPAAEKRKHARIKLGKMAQKPPSSKDTAATLFCNNKTAKPTKDVTNN